MATTFFEELKLEGRTGDRAVAILTFLETRFGNVSKTIRERIEACTDRAVLDRLTRLAASCESSDEFKKTLKYTVNRGKLLFWAGDHESSRSRDP